MSLSRQIWVVLLSYLTRTGFRWAIVSGLSGFSLMLIGAGCGMLLPLHPGDDNPFKFLIELGIMTIVGSVVAALILFAIHARNQLMGHVTRLVPNTRTANLIVAAGLLAAIVIAMMTPMWDDAIFSLPIVFLLLLGMVTLIAWAVCNPWLTPVPVAVLWVANHSEAAQSCLFNVSRRHDWTILASPNPTAVEFWKQTQQLQLSLRVTLVLGNILALLVLERLARPRKIRASFIRWRAAIGSTVRRTPILPARARHPFIESQLARTLHRRFAVRDWRAPLALMALVAVLTGLLDRTAGTMSSPLIPTVALLAILPGALAAIGWRDRWGSYEFETLYPVKHQQLVSELLSVLVLDIVEYWLASVVAMLLTIRVLQPALLHESLLWVAISGTAMMQTLWIGVIPLAGQRRRTIPFVAGLSVVAICNLLAFDNLLRSDSILFRPYFVPIAAIEMLAGFLFLAIATLVWRRRAAA